MTETRVHSVVVVLSQPADSDMALFVVGCIHEALASTEYPAAKVQAVHRHYVVCERCGRLKLKPTRGSRITRRFCSDACRVAAYRARTKEPT